jgi:hypothetical protein
MVNMFLIVKNRLMKDACHLHPQASTALLSFLAVNGGGAVYRHQHAPNPIHTYQSNKNFMLFKLILHILAYVF